MSLYETGATSLEFAPDLQTPLSCGSFNLLRMNDMATVTVHDLPGSYSAALSAYMHTHGHTYTNTHARAQTH